MGQEVRGITRLLDLFAALLFLAAIAVNPWSCRVLRGDTVLDYLDVLRIFAATAVVSALVLWLLSVWIRRTRSALGVNASVLAITIVFFLILDRSLLVYFGLPLWIPDTELHFRHRPDAIRTWERSGDAERIIRINSYGHHDDPFPESKGLDEFRILVVGNSIAMGHGVTRDLTFSNQLERKLAARLSVEQKEVQVINTAVQGYAAFQELIVFEESLRFDPDHLLVAFCMNDVTEPLIVNRGYGGVGIDYHGVSQISSRVLSYLLNETGVGRAIQERRLARSELALEQKLEVHNLRHMTSHDREDPVNRLGWEAALRDLEKIYVLAGRERIGVTLLIFPHTFQLGSPGHQQPQGILEEHAKRFGIPVIDFTRVFELAIIEDAAGAPPSSQAEMTRILRRYFLDSDHYTIEGHGVVAEVLFGYLNAQDWTHENR